MIVKLLTEHHLEFLSLTGGYTGSYELTLVKTPNCWKSHIAAQILMASVVKSIILPQFPLAEYFCSSISSHVSHTLTGLEDEGCGILLFEQASQNISPQFLQ